MPAHPVRCQIPILGVAIVGEPYPEGELGDVHRVRRRAPRLAVAVLDVGEVAAVISRVEIDAVPALRECQAHADLFAGAQWGMVCCFTWFFLQYQLKWVVRGLLMPLALLNPAIIFIPLGNGIMFWISDVVLLVPL